MVRSSGPAPLQRARVAQSGRDHRSKQRPAHQLMAIFGWRTLKMAEQYTRAADQQRLANAAMHMLDTQEQTRTESCPTDTSGGTFSAKTEAKSKTNFWGGAQERTRTSTPCSAST